MEIFNNLHIHFLNILEENVRRRELHNKLRTLRDVSNPFTIPEAHFLKLYRMPPVIVRDIVIPQLEVHLQPSQRNTCVPVHIKVLATLHLLSQGSYQSSLGKDCDVAVMQSTDSKIISEVLEIIVTHLFPVYVKFPNNEDTTRIVKQGFHEKFQFPNVIGAIDCTHIAIHKPPIEHPDRPALAYYNRKGYYSINVQAVCDSNLKILAINARYPGTTHDAAIWATSSVNRYLRRKFLEGDQRTWLLGDSGYPLSPWLMTPIMDAPENSPEARYTVKHIRARNTIERCFGVLKNRFRCLLKHRVLDYSHRKAGLIVYACATLHNILVEHRIDLLDDEEEPDDANNDDEEDYDDEQFHLNVDADVLDIGRRQRNQLVRILDNQ